MGTRGVTCVVVAVLWACSGSGCAWKKLKDSNRRLKESNDRLIAENNRLEEELAALSGRLGSAAPVEPPVVTKDTGVPQERNLLEEIDEPGVDVGKSPAGDVLITIQDRVFFAPGSATISARGKRVLTSVARGILAQYPGQTVRVDGHTDDTPIRKVRDRYPTNWELSTARACTVVRYLIRQGIPETSIYPAGFSYYRPAGRSKQQNRRVEITVYRDRTTA